MNVRRERLSPPATAEGAGALRVSDAVYTISVHEDALLSSTGGIGLL